MANRTPPLAGAPLFAGHMSSTLCYSSNPALVDWLRIGACNTRALLELSMGPGGVIGAACTSRNARGLYGEDASGAGYGPPINHSVFEFGAVPTASPTGASPPARVRYPPLVTNDGTTSDEITGAVLPLPVPVKACYPGGAYEELQVDVWAYVSNADAGNASDFFVRVYSPALGGYTGQAVELEDDLDTTGHRYLGDTIRVLPGQINPMIVTLSSENDAANSNATTVQLVSIAFSQVDE